KGTVGKVANNRLNRRFDTHIPLQKIVTDVTEFKCKFHKEMPKIRIHKESIQRFKRRVRELTSRKQSIDMERRIERLNRYFVGWLGYYQLTEAPSVLKAMDSWIRRRLRMIRWKEWKKVKTKYKN